MPNEEDLIEAITPVIEEAPSPFDTFFGTPKTQFNPSAFPHSDKPFHLNVNMEEYDCDFSWGDVNLETPTGEAVILTKKKTVAAAKKFRVIARCCECKKDILEDGKTQYFRNGLRDNYGERNLYYCSNCADKFEKCACCGHNYHVSKLQLKHCPYCIEEAPNRYIEQYNTKVEQKIEKKGDPRDQIFFGVEVEYASSRLGLDTLIVRDLVKDFAALKRDRSITLNGVEYAGFEIVSCPCSLEVHNSLWDNMFNNLPETSFPNESCGMHVHASRVRMGDLQLGKIIQLIHEKKNRVFIEAIAERASGHHNNFHDPRPIMEAKEGGFYKKRDRHSALNLNNPNTIEFRLFASTKDKFSFLKNIEFCRAVIKFTGMGEYSLIQTRDFQVFFDYVKRNYKEYPNLWQFLRTNKVCERLNGKK